jgi:hypothetical protein
MRYATGEEMALGDEVLAGGMNGVIVCDFDNHLFAEGFEGWDMPTVEMLGGGTLSSGVLVETKEAGLIHYESGTTGISLVRASRCS